MTFRIKIPVPTLTKDGQPAAVFMKDAQGPCDIHDWATEGLAARFVEAMVEKQDKGGVTACVECVARAKQDADAVRAAMRDKGTK